MKIETWIDRITDETNLWHNATKMENGGNFFEAFFLYLKSAEDSLKQNSLIRAALSSSCAANCLSMTGNLAGARQLYLQTAMIYEINGDTILDKSVRETLWSYQESYEYYQLSCDSEKAQTVYEKYVSLARRVNPFEGEEAMKSLRLRKKSAEENKNNITITNIQISTQAVNAMESFLRTVESVYNEKNPQAQHSIIEEIHRKGTKV